MRDGRVCVRVRGVAPRGCSRRGSHRSGACAHDAVVNGVCQGATSQGTARRPCVTLLAAPRRLPPPRRELGAPAVPARPAPGSQAPLPPSAALSQERATSVQLWLRRRGWARRTADARFDAAGGVRCIAVVRPRTLRPSGRAAAACASRTRSLAARRRAAKMGEPPIFLVKERTSERGIAYKGRSSRKASRVGGSLAARSATTTHKKGTGSHSLVQRALCMGSLDAVGRGGTVGRWDGGTRWDAVGR